MPSADRLHHAVLLRLTERQYRHVIAQATLQEIPISEAVRRDLDAAIERQPDLEGDVQMSYADLLQAVELETAADA